MSSAAEKPAAFVVRPATVYDRPALTDFYRQTLAIADWIPAAAKETADFEHDTVGERVLVAVNPANEPIGFVSVWEPESFIHHLYVREAEWGMGVGRSLLAHLRPLVRRPWRLKCLTANARALGFYRALGWRELETGMCVEGEYILFEFQDSPEPH